MIVKRVTLIDPPLPPFVGTRLDVAVGSEQGLKFGMGKLTLAEGREGFSVDWGDGAVDRFAETTENVVHQYARAGRYEVRVSDDVQAILVSGSPTTSACTVYAPCVLNVRSDATALTSFNVASFHSCANLVSFDAERAGITRLTANLFKNCTSLTSPIRLPSVSGITGSAGAQPFAGCTGLREIHFSAQHEEALRATACYRNDPHLGAANATVSFDLV